MNTACYAVVFLLLSTWSAEAAVLCARKDREGNAYGAITVRQECKKKEVQLDPEAIGLQRQSLAIFDVNGKKVGDVTDLGLTFASTFFKVGEVPFILTAYREYLTGGTYPVGVLWESPDCSGAPFLSVPGSGAFLVPLSIIKGPGRMVYVADMSVPSRTITARSEWLDPPSSVLPFGACTPISNIVEAWPATPVVDLGTIFTPPFSVR
jgi:hypothetical protein